MAITITSLRQSLHAATAAWRAPAHRLLSLPPGREAVASRFAPLEDAEGANWSRKPYHCRALAHPDTLQVSRPYLSVANSCLCVTLSMTVTLAEGRRVLCCDINWED